MLRITVQNHTGVRLVLEGKLVSVWVRELKACCQDILARSDPADVWIELTDVSFVDAVGKELLAELYREGVHLLSDDVAMDALVRDISASGDEEHDPSRR
jgi:ABC-type transporter Mla MlaB component